MAAPATAATSHPGDAKLLAAAPDSTNLPWEKGSVAFGGFLTALNSTLAFGINNLGIAINAENTFGLKTELFEIRADALYRPGKTRRNQIDFTYAGFHRNGSAVIGQDIEIGNVTIPAHATVDTVFNFDLIRASYSYAFLQDDRVRIAGGLGVYAVPLRYSVNARSSTNHYFVEAADCILPLPALALRGDFLLTKKVYLHSSIDLMYAQIGDFKGSLLDVNVAVEYRPWKHLGFGLGYSGFSTDVEAHGKKSDYPEANFIGEVGVRYTGIQLYGKFIF